MCVFIVIIIFKSVERLSGLDMHDGTLSGGMAHRHYGIAAAGKDEGCVWLWLIAYLIGKRSEHLTTAIISLIFCLLLLMLMFFVFCFLLYFQYRVNSRSLVQDRQILSIADSKLIEARIAS